MLTFDPVVKKNKSGILEIFNGQVLNTSRHTEALQKQYRYNGDYQ